MGGRGRQISEFEASLVYRVISRTSRAIHTNPFSKKKKKKKNKKQKRKKKEKKRERQIDIYRERTLNQASLSTPGL